MPIRYKHTWFFASPRKGWTESLYTQPTTENVQAQMNQAQQVAIARAAMLGEEAYVQAYRAQQVENAAGEEVRRVGYLLQNETYLGQQGSLAQADLSVLFRFYTAAKDYSKASYAGGIPDSIEVGAGAYEPDAAFVNAWQNWGNKLVSGGGYGWLSRVPSALSYSVVAMDQAIDGQVEFEFSGTPFTGASPVAQQCRLTGIQSIGGLSGINGDILLVPTGVNTAITKQLIAILPWTGGGVMRTYSRAYRAIDSIFSQKVVSRERGAPLLQSAGRRRGRARR